MDLFNHHHSNSNSLYARHHNHLTHTHLHANNIDHLSHGHFSDHQNDIRKFSGSGEKRNSDAHSDQHHHEPHIHPHLHEHHQVLYPNNLATHMMAVKVSWYKTTRSVIEISAAIFLIIGSAIFMTGFLKLIWARTALTSVQAGSYMIGSFLTISSASLGLIGAYQENWCLITSYACVQLVLFVLRTVVLMVAIKINFSVVGFDDSFKTTKPFSDIPYMMSGLPGTSELVPLELLYSVIEISLCVSAFYISYAINKASKEHIEHEHQAYVLPVTDDQTAKVPIAKIPLPVVPTIKTPKIQTANIGMANMKVPANVLPVNYMKPDYVRYPHLQRPYGHSSPFNDTENRYCGSRNQSAPTFSPFDYSENNHNKNIISSQNNVNNYHVPTLV